MTNNCFCISVINKEKKNSNKIINSFAGIKIEKNPFLYFIQHLSTACTRLPFLHENCSAVINKIRKLVFFFLLFSNISSLYYELTAYNRFNNSSRIPIDGDATYFRIRTCQWWPKFYANGQTASNNFFSLFNYLRTNYNPFSIRTFVLSEPRSVRSQYDDARSSIMGRRKKQIVLAWMLGQFEIKSISMVYWNEIIVALKTDEWSVYWRQYYVSVKEEPFSFFFFFRSSKNIFLVITRMLTQCEAMPFSPWLLL